jgi:hypothetical protein
MNPLSVNFRELYERHLCRHSQFGINVIHLAAVTATYAALLGLLRLAAPGWAPAAVVAGAYLAAVAVNLPPRLIVATAAYLAALLALVAALPTGPWWAYLFVIVGAHQAQNWSHRHYDHAADMTAFNAKYRKGPALFVLLSLYELPILLNYLVFGRRDWRP